jgi:flagellar biosynthesis protein FliQ
MNTQVAVDVIRQALFACFWTSLPLLAVGFIAGVILSFVQLLTSIQDSSFSSVPKLAAFWAACLVLLPWLAHRMTEYAVSVFGNLHLYAK